MKAVRAGKEGCSTVVADDESCTKRLAGTGVQSSKIQ
jgi:hypothetical protein